MIPRSYFYKIWYNRCNSNCKFSRIPRFTKINKIRIRTRIRTPRNRTPRIRKFVNLTVVVNFNLIMLVLSSIPNRTNLTQITKKLKFLNLILILNLNDFIFMVLWFLFYDFDLSINIIFYFINFLFNFSYFIYFILIIYYIGFYMCFIR